MRNDPVGWGDDNPYAPPRAALLDAPGMPSMPGWSSTQLQVLGGLALVTALGSLVILLMSVTGLAGLPEGSLYVGWLGPILVLLANYLLIRLKAFVEARFAVHGLGWPVWLAVAFCLPLELLLQGLEFFPLGGLQGLLQAVTLMLHGGLLIWLGLRLRAIPGGFRVLRAVGWLAVAGGLMLASQLLAAQAVQLLLMGHLLPALVFFRGAAEIRGRD